MKPITLFLLAGSLALNAALAITLFVGLSASAPAPVAPAPLPERKPAAVAPTLDAETWNGLATSNLPDLVGRLRREGFPPDVVRAIIAAQINEQFAARRKALDPAGGSRPFWKDLNHDANYQSAVRQLYREQRAALRDLLGADAESNDPLRDLYQNRSFTFLAPEKAVDLRQLLQDFDERRADAYSTGAPDRTKLSALEKEQADAIAALLTPEELQDYKLRASNTANALRDLLSAFEPTEEEFRAFFKLREPIDEKYGSNAGMLPSDASMRDRSAAEREAATQFKATLSPERAAAFDRATDFNYRRTSQFIARLDLPADTTDRVWQAQKQFEQRRNDIFRTATPEQRTPMLAALQQEAVATIAPLIGGERNIDSYKQYGGNWLQSLVPPVRPATKR
jgi:hypothetical protein